MESRLSEALLETCVSAEPRLRSDVAARAVAGMRERLADRTLRVAVGGRVKAGKSTLVNALLGQRLAPTRETECTLIAAWFRYHYQNSVLVHLRDGGVVEVPGRPGGGVPDELPDDLPYRHTEVSQLTVRAADRRIARDFVLIDTPGGDSLSGLDDYSMESIRRADALIYVTQDAGEVDLKALESFRGEIVGARLSATNVVAVLSQVDKIDDGEPPEIRRRTADRIARRAARGLRGLVAEVVPVAGLVAQTARGGEFTETHAAALRTLARADAQTRRTLLYADDWFLDRAHDTVPVDRAMRAELLALLDRYGVEEALAAIDAGAADATAILDALEEISGIRRLLAVVQDRFMAAADALRVDAAATALEQELAAAGLPGRAGDPDERRALDDLLTHIRSIRRDPAMRAAALAEVAQAHAAGTLPLDDTAQLDLHQLVSGQTAAQRLGRADADPPDVLRAAAAERVTRWRQLEARLPRRDHARDHATLVRETLEHLYFTVGAGS